MNRYWFELKEGVLFSLKAIRVNKIRAMLTTLGIIIGICSVSLMSTAIKGMDKAFQEGISALGSDNIYVSKWPWFDDHEWWRIRRRPNITVQDFDKFQSLAKKPIAMAPTIISMCKLQYNDSYIESALITGTTAEYVKTTNFEFASGRFMTGIETDGARNVAVIGHDVSENLFKFVNPINQEIEMNGVKFKIVGVLKKMGSNLLGGFNPDNQVYIPLGSAYRYFVHRFRSIDIVVRAANTAMVKETAEEAEEVMRRVRSLKYNEENNFAVNQQEGLTSRFDKVVMVIKIVGFFITGLSLLVGAIGIMNIMFVSVKERTKEIGIRKAIGAKRRTILTQFLSEAALICLMGGLIGLGLAVLASIALDKVLPTSIQVDTILIAIFISLITGVVSGFIPAYSAAKMDPVDALRYE